MNSQERLSCEEALAGDFEERMYREQKGSLGELGAIEEHSKTLRKAKSERRFATRKDMLAARK